MGGPTTGDLRQLVDPPLLAKVPVQADPPPPTAPPPADPPVGPPAPPILPPVDHPPRPDPRPPKGPPPIVVRRLRGEGDGTPMHVEVLELMHIPPPFASGQIDATPAADGVGIRLLSAGGGAADGSVCATLAVEEIAVAPVDTENAVAMSPERLMA